MKLTTTQQQTLCNLRENRLTRFGLSRHGHYRTLRNLARRGLIRKMFGRWALC